VAALIPGEEFDADSACRLRHASIRMSAHRQRNFDIFVLCVTQLAIFVVAIGLEGPVRYLIVLLAAILVPGAAVVSRLQLRETSAYLALTVAISLAVCTVGAMAMVWGGFWHPLIFGTVLALASTAVLVYDVWRITREESLFEVKWV
jgi:hypothetical protein